MHHLEAINHADLPTGIRQAGPPYRAAEGVDHVKLHLFALTELVSCKLIGERRMVEQADL